MATKKKSARSAPVTTFHAPRDYPRHAPAKPRYQSKIVQLVPPMSYAGDDVINGVSHVRYYPKDGSAANRVAVEAWALMADGSVVALVRDESMTRLVMATDLVEKYGELKPQSIERFAGKTVEFHATGARVALPSDITDNFESNPPAEEDLNYSGVETNLLSSVKQAISSGDAEELARCFGVILAPDRLYQQWSGRLGGTIEGVLAEAKQAAQFHRVRAYRNDQERAAEPGKISESLHHQWLPLLEKFLAACEPAPATASPVATN
jgi:hypothetical protein